jgi:hypothetical protein
MALVDICFRLAKSEEEREEGIHFITFYFLSDFVVSKSDFSAFLYLQL